MSNFGRSPLEHAPHIRYVNAIWSHHGAGTAGIVQLYDTITDEHKFYWGATSGGSDEWSDILQLSNYGHKLPVKMVRCWLNVSGNPFDEAYFNDKT